MNTPTKVVAAGSGRKLFKHYMNENMKVHAEQKMFYYRVNRWRWNTKDNTTGELIDLTLTSFLYLQSAEVPATQRTSYRLSLRSPRLRYTLPSIQ